MWMEIFRAGKHTDSAGETAEWTADDLAKIATNFADPKPLTIKHPKQGELSKEMAWGWMDKVKVEAGKLFAHVSSLVPEFEAMLKNKMVPNRSVGLEYGADGAISINHVAFLGVTPPAVKGMEEIEFQAASKVKHFEMAVSPEESGIIEKTVRSTLRFLGILKGGKDEFSEDVGGPAAEEKKGDQAQEAAGAADPTPEKKESDMTEQEAAELKAKAETAEQAVEAVKVELSAAKVKIAEFETEKAAAAETAKKAEFSAFVETQIAAGKVLPAERDNIIHIMGALDASKKIEFSAADGTKSEKTSLEVFRASIESRPADKSLLAEFAANGERRELPGGADITAKAKAIAAEQKIDFNQAVRVVLQQNPELNTPDNQ